MSAGPSLLAVTPAIELHNISTQDVISNTKAYDKEHSNASLRSARSSEEIVPVVAVAPEQEFRYSHARSNLIIFQIAFINILNSVSTGIVVVALPRITEDLQIPAKLYLWPTSVQGLVIGSTLLLSGAVTEVFGTRIVELTGSLIVGIFTLACGFSRDGIQIVMFRALQGVGMAMHLPCTTGLITEYVPSGRRRNFGFACLGMGMTMGYYTGLVMGGLLTDSIGWRAGFYIAGGLMLLQTVVGVKIIPKQKKPTQVLTRLKNEIDWIGASIACTGLAIFSYVLAVLSADKRALRQPGNIIMLLLSCIFLGSFPFWMNFQTKHGRPALVPNRLWRNRAFSTICLLAAVGWAVANSLETFASLYFQEVQHFSAFQASLRFLPTLAVGILLQIVTGMLVDKASVFWIVIISALLTAGCPLLMANMNPAWPYWYSAFPAQILLGIHGDLIYTVTLIVVSEVFPEKEQPLAGAIVNTIVFFGWSLGININQVISMLVTEATTYRDKTSPMALLKGYQASFWAMFAATIACCIVAVFGLRNMGRIGLKRD